MTSVAKTMLEFLKRSGHDVTIADNGGQTHHATLTRIEESASVREDGSFTFGYARAATGLYRSGVMDYRRPSSPVGRGGAGWTV